MSRTAKGPSQKVRYHLNIRKQTGQGSYERENPRTQSPELAGLYHLVHAVIHVCLVYWIKA